ncbi:hypothetical protein QOZ80_7BG0608230 [Eleusine coracana subsp. coracana]|nr:hypothetical protein QOZ80_7BG0608230 [Eleusine coracana subsp. coracana]
MSREREDQQEPTTATTSSSDSDWLDDSLAFLAADLGHGFEGYGWLLPPSTEHEQQQHDAGSAAAPYQSILPQPAPGPAPSAAASSSPQWDLGGQPKKRKSPGSSCSRKPRKKGGGGNKGGAAGTERDARWAEQLLNPCAAAVEAGNLPRAHHLLFVLGELASSSSGEPNHRLAAHGLRALAPLLPSAAPPIKTPFLDSPTPPAFRHVDPRLFRAALIRFHEASPWFALPNALANAAIVATRGTTAEPRRRRIHVVDVGVSHGVQWPTLLDALATARGAPRGAVATPTPTPPPSVRLTVVAGPTATSPPAPFSASPPGYDSAPQLLRYARSVGLDLAIDHAACLDTLLQGVTTTAPDEVRVVCLQFRLSYITAEEQAAVLEKVRSLNPELVVLSELDHAVRSDYGSMASEFAARLEMLWAFLESTVAAFKGRDVDERRVMEAEAGMGLTMPAAAFDGSEAWRARMAAAGFVEAAFGGEAVETARALMRRYDSGWELVPPLPATGAAVGLRWKGQPVSFCSLWRPA